MKKTIKLSNLKNPNILNFSIFSKYKELYFIFPYISSRAVTMLLNLWTLAYIINNFEESAFSISRYMIYGFIVDFLRNIYIINYSRIPFENRDFNNIFSSINLLISLGCSLICSLFIYNETRSFILSLTLFFITLFVSFDIDVIRANNKKQPINQYLFLLGLIVGIFVLLINSGIDNIGISFWALLQPFLITAIHNAVFLFNKLKLLNKMDILKKLILENLNKINFKPLFLALLPGFILNAPLTLVTGNNNLLLNLSLVNRIFNLFVSIIPIINNLSLKGFFERKKHLFFNNERIFMLICQVSFGSMVSICGFIFLNLFLGNNITLNLYFYGLILFISFSIFHSRIILPKNVNNSLSSTLQNFYLIFISVLFILISKILVVNKILAIFFLVLFQSLILVISSRLITNKK